MRVLSVELDMELDMELDSGTGGPEVSNLGTAELVRVSVSY